VIRGVLVGCRAQPRPADPPAECCCVYAGGPDEAQLSLITAAQCAAIEGASCAPVADCTLGP
jgi:hypothetical protein